MGKKYADPPIVEAVCEFRLTRDSKWDLTTPGLIYEKVSTEFPNKEQRLVQEVQITQSPQGLQQQIRSAERILFLATDRKTFVQVGPHFVGINSLKPYPTWSGFKPRIESAFRALTEIVEVKGLQRIGLRYINRVEIPDESVRLEEYFEFRPFWAKDLPYEMTAFIVGSIFSFFGGQDACRVDLSEAIAEKPGSRAFILDLDYFLAQPQSVSAGQALEWVDRAHQRVEEIFEACITDRLRQIFGEVK